MSNYFERFARQLAQDAFKRTGELIIDVCHDRIPVLKPAIEELQNGTRRYPKSKTSQKERVIRDRLAAGMSGSRTEVKTATGKIDILTASQVIEVKNVRQYKHAIGQVLSYSHYYPKHERCIYLFGKVSAKQRRSIEKECKTAKVTVVFV
ncbi:hypothetical protein [Baaleninema sp.]|uniref:hypothetical protein n=1 Tax=Baaleninema sp. TaxID=3101197 RepID=UPI003CFDEFED